MIQRRLLPECCGVHQLEELLEVDVSAVVLVNLLLESVHFVVRGIQPAGGRRENEEGLLQKKPDGVFSLMTNPPAASVITHHFA